MSADYPSNTDDVIDSRDIIRRIEELESDIVAGVALTEDEAEELASLKAFAAEAADATSEWEHGATFIRDDYFEDYAQDLAQDIGAMKDVDTWPLTCIDWEKAARELQYDYTSVEWDGVTYWVRS